MITVAPPWVFAAEAVDGEGDTHLVHGVHVRALPSPRAGIPATPLFVSRAVLRGSALDRAKRTDITWIDSHGTELTPPFDVHPGNPVLGYFPSPDCVLVRLLTKESTGVGIAPGSLTHGMVDPAPPPPPAAPAPVAPAPPAPAGIVKAAPGALRAIPPAAGEIMKAGPVVAPPAPAKIAGPAAADLREAVVAPAAQAILHVPPDILRPIRIGLVFEALVNSQDGPGVVARRAEEPYIVAEQRIDLVRVSGSGTVTGAQWMSRGDLLEELQLEPWRIWSLPVEPAPRYQPTPTAVADAKQRVLRGAPTHQPMYAAFSAASPAAAPAATPTEAATRVGHAAPELGRWLQVLLHDMSAPTYQISDVQALSGAQGQVSLPIEPHLIASAVDPDVGHWLGFGDVDDQAGLPPGSLVIYAIRGLWRWAPERWDKLELSTLAPFVHKSLAGVADGFPEAAKAKVLPREGGAYADFTALALAIVGVPSAPPYAPSISAADDGGWLPEPPPPDVRRILTLRAGGFVPRALAAFAAHDARGMRTLNPIAKIGRLLPGKPVPAGTSPLPLAVSRPPDATAPGQGRFQDRDAPEGPVDYRLAQCDWFGRWSPWATWSASAKARTAPHAPVIELFYTPPTFTSPLPSSDAAGTLAARVAIPRTPDLPAGGDLLQRLALDLSIDGGAPATTSYVLASLSGATIEPHPAPEHDLLVITPAAPAIPRSGSRKVKLVARWVDQGGRTSLDSAPATRTLVDPRPPPLPTVQTYLQYSARPDATGHARVELSWPSAPGALYRVYASNETTLLASLRNGGSGSVADAIAATGPGAPRAMALRAQQQLFGWGAFECVTPQAVKATGTTTRFVHRVSGSLDVLATYRVLSQADSGVLAEITEAELIPVAVPNWGPPPQPLVSLEREPSDHETEGVILQVKVPPGRSTPVAFRLRRASVPVADALEMDVVLSGAIASGATTASGTSFEIHDPSPLKRWRQYRFVVEVQAGPPPGAPTSSPVPAGEWSGPSGTVPLAIIPQHGPAAPASVVAAPGSSGGGAQLTITHPAAGDLIGTALGAYRFEIYRMSTNARPVKLAIDVTRGAGNTFTATDVGPLPPAPAQSQWSVRVIDPIGRPSDATPSNRL